MRLAEQMLKTCTQVGSKVYQIPVSKIPAKGNIARYFIGNKPPLVQNEKVLMLVGAAGTGKSTLIDTIVNYILGVEWTDPFRFKMTVDQPGQITAYSIYHMDGSPCPDHITIVDTPGFSTTSENKGITQQIKEFFSLPPCDGGIDHIDGIGFVTSASTVQLTHAQKYVFDSILSTFGEDIASNIFLMTTLASGGKPPVVDAIKASGAIPYRKYFKFNNSPGDSNEEGKVDRMLWTMGMMSVNIFFNTLELAEPRSLQLMEEVLKEHQCYEIRLSSLKPHIVEGVKKHKELQAEQKLLKEHKAEIERNKDFVRRITVTRHRRIKMPNGQYLNNCSVCNRASHHGCSIADDQYKYDCSVMDDGGSPNARHTMCPRCCPCYFELYQEEETQTIEEIKRRYDAATQGKAKAEAMIREIERQLEQLQKQVYDKIQEIQKSANRLREIALRENPLSKVEYIELMIETQQQSAWRNYLKETKKQVKIVAGVGKMQVSSATSQEDFWTKIKSWLEED